MKYQLITAAAVLVASAASADPLNCSLTGYKAAPGLAAAIENQTLAVTWDGDNGAELRLRFTIEAGTPTIRELAVKKKGGQWATLAANLTPEFRVVSGMRRITQQQLRPDSIQALGGKVSDKVMEMYRKDDGGWIDQAVKEGQIKEADVERWKWEAFWDAPLYVEGSGVRPPTHATSIPPINGIFGQKGLPRTPDEINRSTASYKATTCEVKSSGARLEITFPGVSAGVFAGRLQYDVFKGTNLVRQVVIAKTEQPSVAYKYDAGLKGLPIQASRVVWRDLAGRWQDQQFAGPVNNDPATVWSSNRLIAAEFAAGSIAAFPPPHSFYGARESNQVLGDSYYRKDANSSYAFGIRQAEKEEDPEFLHNFALTSARPGTWQQMPVFLYISAERAPAAVDAALTFTHGDTFKPLPGYQVMGSHYHVGMVPRLKESGSLDDRLNDVESAKAIGINIFGVIDGARGGRAGGDAFLAAQAEYYDAARRQSDKTFLVMPNMENTGVEIGGHHDLMLSKPVYWTIGRKADQPLVETDAKYGKVYHLGGPADFFDMTRRENLIVNMPHPRAKASTGFPDGVKETHFAQDTYEGAGYRWGMGIDGSEKRLCEYRCLGVFDEMTNWYVDRPIPLKHMQAISEARSDIGERGRPPYDALYANGPVNYVKLDKLPTVDDMSPIINAMKSGDYFVSSGEVLISHYAVEGSGDKRTITAEVEWTFPLEFVEVVWGDGQKTERQIISTADLPPFGKKRFQIPFNAAGKKWVRFAAWDIATNGAFVQPIRLKQATATTAGR